MGSGSVWAQMLVSAVGLSLMSAVAYLASWSKRIEKSQIAPAPQRKMVTIPGPKGPRFHPREPDIPASGRWLGLIHGLSSEVLQLVQSHASGYSSRH